MRVLLINPWADEELPPPSVGYIQGTLKHLGVDVKASNLEEAMRENDDYDIVAVSFHSFSVIHARSIRNHFSKARLICGGHHPSALPEQMLSIGYDQVVVGEGENAIVDIINGDTEPIKRISTKHFKTINDIPIPDYSDLNFHNVIGIPVITSRGCPFNCNFCASTKFWNNKYVMRTADNVLAEIDHWKTKGYSSWDFHDDNFTANRKRALEICAGMDGKNIWRCTSRAETLDYDFCRELYRAGCRSMWLGIESLSQDALDRMNKRTTVEVMLSGVEACIKAGINAFCLFLVGLPGDTHEDVLITKNKIRQSNITCIGTNIAWILPQTNMYYTAKEHGMSDDVYLTTGVPFYTYEQPIEILRYWSNLINTARQ